MGRRSRSRKMAKITKIEPRDTSESGANPRSQRYIFEWLQEYLKNKFSLVGVVDILSHDETAYRWDNEAKSYAPRSPYFLYIYKNNISGG